MRKKNEQGTTEEQDKARLKRTFMDMWPNPLAKGIDKKTRGGDFLHALMNRFTEATRRNAQWWTKFYMTCIFALFIMLVWSVKRGC